LQRHGPGLDDKVDGVSAHGLSGAGELSGQRPTN
jgi:hypothetical protein